MTDDINRKDWEKILSPGKVIASGVPDALNLDDREPRTPPKRLWRSSIRA
jgi:hypothetical protein